MAKEHTVNRIFNNDNHDQPQQNTPERYIEEKDQVSMPDGLTREIVQSVLTRTELPNRIATYQGNTRPTLDCGCSMRSSIDVVQCSNPDCKAVVCALLHANSCPLCGKMYCSACLKMVQLSSYSSTARICVLCEKDLTTHPIVKFINKFVWGK